MVVGKYVILKKNYDKNQNKKTLWARQDMQNTFDFKIQALQISQREKVCFKWQRCLIKLSIVCAFNEHTLFNNKSSSFYFQL